eukprot:205771-Pyramimonas_sp.AAC.1
MSQAKVAEYHGAGHLRTQSCESVSSESGPNTSAQGALERRVARKSQSGSGWTTLGQGFSE